MHFRRLEKEMGQHTTEYRQQLIRQTEMVGFSKTLPDLRSLVNTLPDNIIVCQVCRKPLFILKFIVICLTHYTNFGPFLSRKF